MKIDKEARQSLEIDDVLELLAAGARSELGKRALVQLEPAADMQSLISRQNLLAAYLSFTESGGNFPWNDAVQIVSAVLVCRLTAKKQYAPAKAVAKPPQPESFAAAFSESVRRAGMSAIQICMFITVFSVLSCYFLLAAGRFLPPEALPLVLGSLELSAGCAALADCALALQWKLCIASALLSFGGVSVLAQSRAAVQEHGLTGRLLLPCKALQAVLSCTLTLIAAPLLHAESWPAAAFSGTQGPETAGAASLLLCSVSLLLFRKKYHSNLHGKRV